METAARTWRHTLRLARLTACNTQARGYFITRCCHCSGPIPLGNALSTSDTPCLRCLAYQTQQLLLRTCRLQVTCIVWKQSTHSVCLFSLFRRPIRKLPGSLRVSTVDGRTAPFPWAGSAGGSGVSRGTVFGTHDDAAAARLTSGGMSNEGLMQGATQATPPQHAGQLPGDGGGSASVVSGRHVRFTRLLSAPVVDLAALRELAWGGVPDELRPTVWRLLTVRA